MTITDPLSRTNRRSTRQTEQADSRQVKNSAGGYVFKVDGDDQLRRFLILGTEGGTYYQGEHELTRENAKLVFEYAENNAVRLVEIVTEISVAGRAPKQNPTIFALAAATTSPDLLGRKAAFDAIPVVIRTGSQLTLFASYVENLRGWGTGLKNGVKKWYDNKNADQLAYQLVKYRQRNGFTQRDLLRLVHPKAATPEHNALYGWVTQGNVSEELPHTVQGFLKAQEATSGWDAIVRDYNLSWEMLPDSALKEVSVWNALLDNGIPLNALIRQLPRLTNLGVIGSPLSKNDRTADIAAKITDQDYLVKSRIHPYNVLVAAKTYASGQGFRSGSSWNPNSKIVDALNDAFYKSFGNVQPANKNTLIALDVSGSMGWTNIANSPLTARDAAAAFSLVTAATEPVTDIFGFSTTFKRLNISPKHSLGEVIRTTSGLPFNSTDASLPMRYALQHDLKVDTFLVFTDNETWAGPEHVHQSLTKYRNKTGINAKLVVTGMTATQCTLADPSDAGSLNVVGFDSAVPSLIADFSAGRI